MVQTAAERMWDIRYGQHLALAFKLNSLKCFKLVPLRSEAAAKNRGGSQLSHAVRFDKSWYDQESNTNKIFLFFEKLLSSLNQASTKHLATSLVQGHIAHETTHPPRTLP